MSSNGYSPLKEEANTYCIVLNIAEGIGFDFKCSNNGVILKVSLNGVRFEVEGKYSQPNTVTFNSNCIWECELEDVKRIKTDNRPVKLECFLNNDSYATGSNSHIGSLLLPLRGMKIINNLTNLQVKPCWCKLNNLTPAWRQNRPQLSLMLSIIKKTIVDHINLEALLNSDNSPSSTNNMTMLPSNSTYTRDMLQSQHGIFIKLLEDVGQIQVGNDPFEDVDIFFVTLTFRQIKNVLSLFNIGQTSRGIRKKSFTFQYDFLGSISNKEIVIAMNDCFAINQKLSLCFRTSFKSLRLYFQRVFYIPTYLYYVDETAIAKFDLNISTFLPDKMQYSNQKESNLCTRHGSYNFEILQEVSPRALQPSVEFLLTLEQFPKNASEKQFDKPCVGNLSDISNQRIQTETEPLAEENKVAHYLQLQQTAYETHVLNSIYPETCRGSETNSIPNKPVCAVALSTDDQFEAQENSNLNFNFIQQLQFYNDWRQYQVESFENELARTKEAYIQELQALWEDHKGQLVACLEGKISKCDQMILELENTQTQLNNLVAVNLKNASIARKVSHEIEASYMLKINQLEREIQCLNIKVQERDIEKSVLKKRIGRLETRLEIYQRADLSLDQLKDVVNDMRNQANRFTAIENFYKEQWLNYMKMLKMNILKLLDERNLSKNTDLNFSLEEIFNEDVINLKSSNNNAFQLCSASSLNSSSSHDDQFF